MTEFTTTCYIRVAPSASLIVLFGWSPSRFMQNWDSFLTLHQCKCTRSGACYKLQKKFREPLILVVNWGPLYTRSGWKTLGPTLSIFGLLFGPKLLINAGTLISGYSLMQEHWAQGLQICFWNFMVSFLSLGANRRP